MNPVRLVAAILASMALSAPVFANTADVKPSETGTASYYADSRETQRTATGEYYDYEALTAAHPSLPLGAWVRVTNLLNGRSVNVRINDRSAPSGRIIDLSKAAAKTIGMIRAGLARVRIERITPPLHRITLHEPPRKPAYKKLQQ